MKAINTLFAVAVLSVAATGAANASDSAADARVRAALSDNVIVGQAQPAAQSSALRQASFADTGMSAAAGRVQQSISAERIQGESRAVASDSQDFANDAGKSVSATRVQNSLSDSNV
ncbi:hypothetical protein [Cobetia sp. L2A1]|uniref:hypothetical protein n=1 Tax=Cobetia sp. L2A1 TaxID=2686360 RepID=UPI00131C1771|nr:hypothetical protein [Cobetia sp. L2A1]